MKLDEVVEVNKIRKHMSEDVEALILVLIETQRLIAHQRPLPAVSTMALSLM